MIEKLVKAVNLPSGTETLKRSAALHCRGYLQDWKKKNKKPQRETATPKQTYWKTQYRLHVVGPCCISEKTDIELNSSPDFITYLQISIQLPTGIFGDRCSKNSVPVFGCPSICGESTCKELKIQIWFKLGVLQCHWQEWFKTFSYSRRKVIATSRFINFIKFLEA